MFNDSIKNQYPFLKEYFESILSKDINRIPHSILFYGQDISAQYELSQEIARLLNCTKNKTKDCNCLNCKWSREKTHPSIMTITNIDSKPSDDETKNVISIKQAKMVQSKISNMSDNFKVFIFSGAKIVNDNWIPTGLNFENFKAEAANSLLKIVEEAPQKTVFIFLTNDKSDVISTIVSRCQTFFVPSFKKPTLSISGTKEIFQDYPNFNSSKLFEYTQSFQKAMENIENIFDKCENYLLSVLKENGNNTFLKQRIIADIKTFEKAKHMHTLGIKSETISEELFLALMRK